MGCEQFREMLSARLDGEDLPGEAAATDAHLAGCAACRQWLDDAAMITRLARIGVVGRETVPDVAPGVLAGLAAPPASRTAGARIVTVLRMLLGLLGAAQLLFALAQVSVPARAGMTMTGTADGATGNHLLHEAAAWNLAVGAAFVFIAARRTRPAAVLPLLTAFVVTLGLLSIDDLLSGAVAWSRLASHALLLAGYAVVVALSVPGLRPADPPTGSRRRPGWLPGSAAGTAVDLPPGRPRGQATARSSQRAA